MFMLYVVATPIGNLEDITLRAIRVLREVGLIAAEDTRKTKRLLASYGINTRLTSYHEYSKEAKLAYLLEQLQSTDVALVSEAGMPGVSDPGYGLVTAAIKEGIRVVPIPGTSAITAAIAVSGMPAQEFKYVGFLPRKKRERMKFLESLVGESCTIVAFESPHRLLEGLKDLMDAMGDRNIAVARELTKFHEEVFRGNISGAIEHFANPRGEFTLVVEGSQESKGCAITPEIEDELRVLRSQGVGAKKAVSTLMTTKRLRRGDVYEAWLKLDRDETKRMFPSLDD